MFYRNRIMGWSPKDGNDMVCISWLLSDNFRINEQEKKTNADSRISYSSVEPEMSEAAAKY
jgi:hypothetical protein